MGMLSTPSFLRALPSPVATGTAREALCGSEPREPLLTWSTWGVLLDTGDKGRWEISL